MNQAQVISVNPVARPIGENCKRHDTIAKISRKLTAPGQPAVSAAKEFVNFLTGINNKVNTSFSGKMMCLRIICGIVLMAIALIPTIVSEGGLPVLSTLPPDTLIECAIGMSLITGFLTRIVTLCGAGWFAYNLYSTILSSTPDIYALGMCLLLVIFMVLGPGLYSIDQMVRYALTSNRRKKATREFKKKEFSYKAFQSLDDLML